MTAQENKALVNRFMDQVLNKKNFAVVVRSPLKTSSNWTLARPGTGARGPQADTCGALRRLP
jgi:hypothetical protein